MAVFNPETVRTSPGISVLVVGNRIQAVEPDASAQVPPGATVINGAGKTALPGRWEMHGHVEPAQGLLNLAGGVTTVRDVGNDTTSLLWLRRAWDEGNAVGPRLVLAGLIDGSAPGSAPAGTRADTEDEARRLVARYQALGYSQIKIYSSLKPEVVRVIVDEAHRRGLRVGGHIPKRWRANDAVRAGFDEVSHLHYLILNLLSDTLNTDDLSGLLKLRTWRGPRPAWIFSRRQRASSSPCCAIAAWRSTLPSVFSKGF